MTTWIVRHVVTGEVVGEHKTKKAASAQADEMTNAHETIKAKHEGQTVAFIVVKVENLTTPDEESAA